MERSPVGQLDPFKVSPSRINALLSCGVAFKLKYVDNVPEEASGSAALFGSVVHQALEDWGSDRSQALLLLMQEAWEKVTEGSMACEFIQAYKRLAVEAIQTKHSIVEARAARGIETKAVHMTNDWKKSNIAKRIGLLLHDYIPRMDADPRTYWRFSERDPLPGLYDESLPLARRYEERWKHLPNVAMTELKATPTWKGFAFDCRIDAIEPLIDKDSGEIVAVGITDYKTYANPPSEHKDYRQVVMYDRGVDVLIKEGILVLPDELQGLPIWVGADYVRWTDSWKIKDGDKKGDPFPPRRYWRMTERDFDRLERELNTYAAIVQGRHFLPAEKGRNPDFCPYPSQCCLGSCKAAGGEATPMEVNL